MPSLQQIVQPRWWNYLQMCSLAERVATLALRTFDDLPTKSKPRIYPDGSREWVPMSAIVLARDANLGSEQLICVALATGCKCLSQSLLPKCHGQVLHDSHAEILALRGLNHFLLSEVYHVLHHEGTSDSPFIHTHPLSTNQPQCPPFAIRPNISIHLFSTEAPCGDASMEVLMSELGPEASIPWELPPPTTPAPLDTISTQATQPPVPVSERLKGRSYFSSLGILRRKPSRPDAPTTLSKSCSDKLTLKQFTSLLSFPTYLFISSTMPNAYLSSLILPADKYSEVACRRAFSADGRMAPLLPLLPTPDPNPPHNEDDAHSWTFHPFTVTPLPQEFEPEFPFPKPKPISAPTSTSMTTSRSKITKATNLSALYILTPQAQPSTSTSPASNKNTNITETLLTGLKQGYSLTNPSPRKASAVSRSSLLTLSQNTARALLMSPNLPPRPRPESEPAPETEWAKCLLDRRAGRTRYDELKLRSSIGRKRRDLKDMVGQILCPGSDGWPRNDGDDWFLAALIEEAGSGRGN